MKKVYIISNNNCDVDAFKNELSAFSNEKNIPLDVILTSDITDVKGADAVVCFGNEKTLEYKQKNNLYSAITIFDEMTLVNDAFGGICFGERGFRNNDKFGREAYDVEAYAELEIERTARTAYELADAKSTNICLVDKADSLASGKLWRKIVTDLNEDYPFVSVKTVLFDNAVKLFSNGELPAPIILTNNFFGGIIENLCNAPLAKAYTGNTTLALFELQDNPSPQQISITIKTLFELCFGM